MGRSKLDINETEKAETGRSQKRFRFECGTPRLFIYCLALIAAFSWMFVLGILVGRGVPLISPKDFSLHAQFVRFLGLGKEPPQPPANVAETWEDPKEIIQALTYYEDLTKKGGPPSPLPKAPSPPAEPVQKGQAGNNAVPKPVASPAPPPAAQGEQHAAQTVRKAPVPDPPKETAGPEPGAEHFTLLISSMREVENANRLMEQLRSKGYSPRLDSLDLSESGRWNRVLVGSFRSREEALHFAAEFNRKERMEGLVIRETD
jgi:cell division septation protein DedD